jgi:hypothetical protein
MLTDSNWHQGANRRPTEMLRPQVTVRWTAAEQADDPSGTRFQPLYWSPIPPLPSLLRHCTTLTIRLEQLCFKKHINIASTIFSCHATRKKKITILMTINDKFYYTFPWNLHILAMKSFNTKWIKIFHFPFGTPHPMLWINSLTDLIIDL